MGVGQPMRTVFVTEFKMTCGQGGNEWPCEITVESMDAWSLESAILVFDDRDSSENIIKK